ASLSLPLSLSSSIPILCFSLSSSTTGPVTWTLYRPDPLSPSLYPPSTSSYLPLHSLPLNLTPNLPISLSFTPSLSLSHTHPPTLPLSLPLSLSLSLLSHVCCSLSLSLSLSLLSHVFCSLL